jgi:hypothetical protein
MISLIIFLILIEIIFKPRLDITEQKAVLLWYGRKVRNYIILGKFG